MTKVRLGSLSGLIVMKYGLILVLECDEVIDIIIMKSKLLICRGVHNMHTSLNYSSSVEPLLTKCTKNLVAILGFYKVSLSFICRCTVFSGSFV